MNKETILYKHFSATVKESNPSSINDSAKDEILEAMDEYAKQVAIAFNDWSDFNEPQYEKGRKWSCAGVIFDHPPKTSELYDLFYKKHINSL